MDIATLQNNSTINNINEEEAEAAFLLLLVLKR